MPSEYTVTLSMEPFLQRFLCFQFGRVMGSDFAFPNRHDFNRLLEFMLMPCPNDYKPRNYGENQFRIVIPMMQHKNVATFNYLSETRQGVFCNKVRRYMYMLFHEQLTEAILQQGYTRIEAIDHLREESGFTPDDYDRLVKEYQRWTKKEYNRRYNNNVKHKKRIREKCN